MRELQGGELKVLLALVREAQSAYHGSKHLTISRKQLTQYTGLSTKSINRAIAGLQEIGLVQFQSSKIANQSQPLHQRMFYLKILIP